MQTRGFWALTEVEDGELQGRLKELVRAGSMTEAQIVAHLAEVDARRLHLFGARSLFQYCLVELGFSESEAWYRICAARAGRRFPLIFELLEKRELHLTAVALLSKYLTDENHEQLLTEARGKTKQQLLELLAQRWPKSEVMSQIRRIPAGAVAAGPTATLEPIASEMYCLQLGTSRLLKEKLELARELMSHANPSGDLAVVVERALDLLIQKLKARHFGQTGANSPLTRDVGVRDVGVHDVGVRDVANATPQLLDPHAAAHDCEPEPKLPRRKRRRIRQDVRRRVAERDGEGCSFVGPAGKRCGGRAFLQLHHEQPWALGGSDALDNVRLFCRAHNLLAARLELGNERINAIISDR